jgi:GT2 family glycosyltransferase
MSRPDARFTVAICTRNRPAQLAETLDALDRLDGPLPPIVVVDQSDEEDPQLVERAARSAHLDLLRDDGRGLCRARNFAHDLVSSEWIVYLDDDCWPEPDWAIELERAIEAAGEADYISGEIGECRHFEGDYLPVSTLHIDREERLRGRWVLPWAVGIGACMAIRQNAVSEVGGFDERIGPGVPDFPCADDMDFNYRFTKLGRTVLRTPKVRSIHHQWRPPGDLRRHYGVYLAGHSGFAIKHLKSGDPVGGAWLWILGLLDVMRLFASAARRRSRFRLSIAIAKLQALSVATAKAMVRSW